MRRYQDQQAKKGQLKAILVKAGKWQTKEELLALIEPFKFEGHGSEAREKAQLAGMGWKPYEAGKFYNEWDHLWYFLAYGEPRQRLAHAISVAAACACNRLAARATVYR